MNMLDLTWESTLKHILNSQTIFIDILLSLGTFPLVKYHFSEVQATKQYGD